MRTVEEVSFDCAFECAEQVIWDRILKYGLSSSLKWARLECEDKHYLLQLGRSDWAYGQYVAFTEFLNRHDSK